MVTDEIAKKYIELEKLKAKSLMYKDVCGLLDKYEKKLLRLYNDAKKSFERQLKKDPKSDATFEALKKQHLLSNQDNAAMELRIELMKRSIAFLEQENEMGNEVEMLLREYEEINEEGEKRGE